jgi:hypothetical protein
LSALSLDTTNTFKFEESATMSAFTEANRKAFE